MASYEEIVLATWLHNIGKLAQRSGTEGFLQSLTDCFPNTIESAEVIRLASVHHSPSSYYESLITQGDRLSAGMEDRKKDSPSSDIPLTHLLSTIRLDGKEAGKKAYAPLRPLEGKTVFSTVPSKITKQQYQELLRDIEKDFQALKGKGYVEFMPALDTLFERYCWCIPADDDAEVSLYHRAKTAAAFAGTLYRYHQAGGTETIEAAENTKDKKLRFITGTLSGIQTYLFDVKNPGDAAKLLRARSFQVWALSECAARNLLAAFKVSAEHIITFAGGRFLLMVPNTADADSVISAARFELESYFTDAFAGKLSFILSDGVPASAEDVQKKNIKNLLNTIEYTTEQAKQRKMQTYLEKAGPILEKQYDALRQNGVCACCGVLPRRSDTETLCENCADLIGIGGNLVKANRIVFTSEPNLQRFGRMVQVTGNDAGAGFTINAYKPGSPLLFLPYTAPQKNGVPLRLDEIAQMSGEAILGTKKLAMFKADIDNLGLIFTNAQGDNASLSRYAALSRLVHYFFSGGYADFADTNYKDTIYTVFSGGDDICVLGPWDRVLRFAADFRKELAGFTNNNPSVTLSAGIALAGPNLPVRNIAEEAEAALEASKKRTLTDAKGIEKPRLLKDGISVFGVTVGWQEYEACLKDAEILQAYLTEKKLTYGMVYKMLDFADRAKRSREGYLRDMIWMSSFRYMTARTIKDQSVRTWFSQFGDPKHIETSRIAVNYALYAQRNLQED